LRPLVYLLVEDNDDHAQIVLRAVKRARTIKAIHRVADGQEALAFLRREGAYAAQPRPDVILLDLKLPKLGGHEVLKIIKEDEDLRSIPVVVLTTSSAEPERLRAYSEHANSYIVKPVSFTRLRKLLEDVSSYWGVWSLPPKASDLDY